MKLKVCSCFYLAALQIFKASVSLPPIRCLYKCVLMSELLLYMYHLQVGLWVQAPQPFLSVPKEGIERREKKQKRIR